MLTVLQDIFNRKGGQYICSVVDFQWCYIVDKANISLTFSSKSYMEAHISSQPVEPKHNARSASCDA